MTPEVSTSSATLAADQGLYNGFLAAGLLWGLWADRRELNVLPRLRDRRGRIRRRHREAVDPVHAGAAGSGSAGASVARLETLNGSGQ